MSLELVIDNVRAFLLKTPEDVRRFVLAGNSRITLSSLRTGERYTLRFKRPDEGKDFYFVSVLTGSDNESSYTYLGALDNGRFRLTRGSKMTDESVPVKAAKFFCDRVLRDGTMPDQLELRHEGRCGKCNRTLTTPESIDRGIGPECWANMGGA